MKFAKFAALLLLVSACASPAPTTETTAAPAPATTAAAPETVALTYRYQPDSQLAYRVQVDQEISIHAEGDAGSVGTGELPLDGDVQTAVETLMSYQVFPGPIDGTTELVVTALFEDVAVTGTMNGEAFSPSQDDLGVSAMAPIDATFIVDETGKIVSSSLDGLGNVFTGGFQALQGLGQENLSRPIGPRFPDRELSIGDSWTDEETVDGPSGPITTRSTHTVTGTEDVDGVETFVIESVADVEAFEIDFTEIFRAMFQGMLSFDNGEGTDAVAEVIDQLEFRIAVAPSRATATTWFDATAGLVRRAEMHSSTALNMTFRGPDETTGEIVGFALEMDLDQSARFDLESVASPLG